jgi:hypothetical protein
MKSRTSIGGLVGATLSWTAAWGSTGTILFNPVAFPAGDCSFSRISSNGNKLTMYQPISSSDSYAIGHDGSRAKVYLIFMGLGWYDSYHNKEVAGVDAIIESAKDILSSPYLSGIAQYGSSGLADFAGYWIDIYNDGSAPPWSNANFCYPHFTGGPNGSCVSGNPAYFEAKTAIAKNPSWAPSSTTNDDARSNPIYVEIHYGGCGGGSNGNGYGPQPSDLPGYKYLSSSVNFIDISVGSVDDVTCFSSTFSHEVVERMSTGGINNLGGSNGGYGGQCTNASQIADGEAEYANYLARLSTPSAPLVTSYWSVMDQAYIVPSGYIPDGFTDQPARILLSGFWNSEGGHASLRKGVLSYIVPDRPNVPSTPTSVIDTQIQAYTIDPSTNIYGLTISGQIKKYIRSGSSWSGTSLTAPGYVASQLVAPRTSNNDPARNNSSWGVAGGGLYMVANYNGATRVWQYSGAGQNWTPLTGTNTSIYGFGALATQGTGQVDLYLMASNGPQIYVWQHVLDTHWKPITGPNTAVLQIAVANNNVYMLGNNGGGNQIWVWDNQNSRWNPISSTAWPAGGLWVAGDILFAMFNNEIYQYVPGADPSIVGAWTNLTGTNTVINELLVQDGIEVYMNGNNGSGYQVWDFQGIAALGTNTTYGWTALTQPDNYQVEEIFLSASDVLDMNAAMNGGPVKTYHYNGRPNTWSPGP